MHPEREQFRVEALHVKSIAVEAQEQLLGRP